MTRLLVVDDQVFCRVQRPTYGVGAMSRLDDETVGRDELDNAGWHTGLEPLPEEWGKSLRVPAIAGRDPDRFWSQTP